MMSPKQHHPALVLALGLALGLALPALAAPTAAPTCTVQVSLGGKRATAQDCDQFVAAHQQGAATWTPLPVSTTVNTVIPTASDTPSPSPTVLPPSSTALPPTVTVPPATAIVATPLAQTDAQRWGIPDYPEVRPQNAAANATRGRALNAALLSQGDAYQRDYLAKVDGNFTGTTEQILEWAARKWFPDIVTDPTFGPDVFKAEAVKESNWYQSAAGDCGTGTCESFGLLQVRLKYWCPVTGCDQVKTSTAFGADVAAAVMRAHYDGVIYTGDYASWNLYPIRPDVPNPMRFRRAMNAWYSGDGASHVPSDWSYNRDGATSEYVGIVLGGKVDEPGAALHGQTLAGYLSEKPWRRGGF